MVELNIIERLIGIVLILKLIHYENFNNFIGVFIIYCL